jgi:crotonobetainyl-CoA:carnitine CoA-transferase CaiB-like acyl-CoA transferase
LEDEKLGKYKQLGIPIKLSETPGSLDKRAPSLGEHNEEILAEIGYKGDDVLRLKQNRVI